MKHQISLQQAIDMTTAFRKNRPEGMPLSETFDRSAIEKIIATPNCHSIRIYYGSLPDGAISAILVAADHDGKDLLPSEVENAGKEAGQPVIVDDGFRCPPHCPPPSPLNS